MPRKRCAGAQAVRRCAPPDARAAPAQAPPWSAPGVAQKKLSRNAQEHSKRLEWDQIWAENSALLGGKVRSDTCQHPQPGACAHRLHTPVPQRIRTVRRLFRPLPPPNPGARRLLPRRRCARIALPQQRAQLRHGALHRLARLACLQRAARRRHRERERRSPTPRGGAAEAKRYDTCLATPSSSKLLQRAPKHAKCARPAMGMV